MKDCFGRKIEYMRISVTDRCNLRCRYCMPPEGIKKVDMSMILTNEEIVSVCRAAVGLGITKFKITGGEPLVRYNVTELVRDIKALSGAEQVTMTTNGQDLSRYIEELSDAGIDAINISLDTLKPEKFRYITRTGDIGKTLEGIELCKNKGIMTKINTLVQRDFNDDEITDLSEYAMERGIDIRFIELMPIGCAGQEKCFTSSEVMDLLKSVYRGITSDQLSHGNGPAIYYKVPGRESSIGIISSVHGDFCGGCNRIRLTSMGYVKPCLCYDETVFIRPYIEKGRGALEEALRKAIESKPAHHSFEHGCDVDSHSMSQIGG